MTTTRSGETAKQLSNPVSQQCSTYVFPPAGPSSPPLAMSGDLPNAAGSLLATSLTSASKGHARSASHGGVGTSVSSSAIMPPRPSALKHRGHQRAFSQGQIVDSAGLIKGHNRVGSRTEFTLPPGHRENVANAPVSVNGSKSGGHSRQASRSESIYTLRHSGPPSLGTQFLNFMLRRNMDDDVEGRMFRRITPNHLVAPRTPKKDHPNGAHPNNRIRTTKYTMLSFLPKNLLEQLHRVANVYFICIVLLNWFPEINAFGKEIAMLPVLFVLGVTAIKDLFEDRRRHASDSRINNSTCRVYKSELGRYVKVLWQDVTAGDLIHLSNNELIPADVLLLRSSNPNGLCYLDTCNLDGETNLKQRQVARGFVNKHESFEPSYFRSLVEVGRPTTKIYQFHGEILHPDNERVSVNTDNLLLRECMLKNTDFVEGIVVYAGHETKAMLNNGGPRYKRSALERQMNIDVIWCVVILVVLCVVGAVGCKLWLSSYEGLTVPFIPFGSDPTIQGVLAFWTYVIILQVMIPLSLYVTMEMAKLLQVYHIHNDIGMYDPETNKRVECRALNIPEEIGQIQYIFSDKTGTLTENKMVFRRCTVLGVDYNHPPPSNAQSLPGLGPGVPIPLLINPLLMEELSTEAKLKTKQSQQIQEFLLVLAVCNTVVVSRHPHHDQMNPSGLIETVPLHSDVSRSSASTAPRNQSYGVKSVASTDTEDRYTRLSESRSITPSPPQAVLRAVQTDPKKPTSQPLPPRPLQSTTLSCLKQNVGLECPPPSYPLPTVMVEETSAPTADSSLTVLHRAKPKSPRSRLLTIPPLLDGKRRTSPSTTSSLPPRDLKPIFEAESPDELALVDAAYSYNCQLVKRTPQCATILLPTDQLVDLEIMHILPFDSTRKCMSIVVRHPITQEITLYSKGADSTILSLLAPTDDADKKALIHRTQQHLNAYGRDGLRVLVMAKRVLTVAEYEGWRKQLNEAEMAHDNHDRRRRDAFAKLEVNLTLLGATGIEDRLQEGVPETIAALISAGIVVWVLTGDKAETAMNIAMSARLFTPSMEILKLFCRSKHQAETSIMFYREQIEGESPAGTSSEGPNANQVDVFARATVSSESVPSTTRSTPRLTSTKRALVVDGRTLTYILDPRSNLTKPFLALTTYCSSVLCCRATPLQKSFIVRVVKEELKMRTLAIGDGANDVSMIQAADVGIGISGQEGMQAVMASDFALSRFKYLERFLLVHGHWCYDRLARMVLYFFYKNALFVFLIFWYQLYCGFSGCVMIDQMYLMLYNLLFTSLPPIVIGVYDQDVPEEILLAQPILFRQGRLGLVYQPHSFWLTMADSLYQSIVIFFITEGAYHDSDVGIWEYGTTVTSACMFVMMVHIAIEVRSWTVMHVLSILGSMLIYFVFSLVYNSICMQCFGLASNYWVVQNAMSSPTHWLVILLVVVMALLPRFLVRGVENCVFPSDTVRTLLEKRRDMQRGEGFLVSWSRSTSTSSIYRTTCAGEFGSKSLNATTLTVVG